MGTGISHARNRDKYLDRFSSDEVSSAEIRAFIDAHTHVEADITDLDKYTQSEVDLLLAGKEDKSDELYTMLLLNFNGPDGQSTTTEDTGLDVSMFGNAELDTAFQKFGTASFIGSPFPSGLYVDDPSSLNIFNSKASVITIDFWYYKPSTISDNDNFMFTVKPNESVNQILFVNYKPLSGDNLDCNFTFVSPGDRNVNFTSVGMLDDTWNHLCFVWENGHLSCFVNGNYRGSRSTIGYADWPEMESGGRFIVGGTSRSSGKFQGNIDAFRMTNGNLFELTPSDGSFSVGSSYFSIPTSEPQVILTEIDQKFSNIDLELDSKVDKDIPYVTESDTAKVLFKFDNLNLPNSAYESYSQSSISTGSSVIDSEEYKFNKASLNLSGTVSGNLAIPASIHNKGFGNFDWTIEFWFYSMPFSGSNKTLLSLVENASELFQIIWEDDGSPSENIHIVSNGTQVDRGTWSPSREAWHHLAITYDSSSSTVKIYGDGQLKGTGTSVTFSSNLTSDMYLGGAGSGTDNLDGYIDQFVMHDSIVFNSNFTPSENPLVYLADVRNIGRDSVTDNLYSTEPGMVRRITTSVRDSLSNIQDGMIIYNTTLNKFQGRENGAWVNLI